jgi:hypothetical protein
VSPEAIAALRRLLDVARAEGWWRRDDGAR